MTNILQFITCFRVKMDMKTLVYLLSKFRNDKKFVITFSFFQKTFRFIRIMLFTCIYKYSNSCEACKYLLNKSRNQKMDLNGTIMYP